MGTAASRRDVRLPRRPVCRAERAGDRVVEALFAEINRLAIERNWAVVRWTTADDNYRARAVYDKRATRTTWITYDMTPVAPDVKGTSAAV